MYSTKRSTLSSVGRAIPLHGKGRKFESYRVHKRLKYLPFGRFSAFVQGAAMSHEHVRPRAGVARRLRDGASELVTTKINLESRIDTWYSAAAMTSNTVKTSPVDMNARKALDVRPGDTVRVSQKIEEEKGKYRLQIFEGLVLARKHGTEAGATFTVRKVSSGVGVEKIFPLYSPMIDKVEIIKRARVRRAKLYYIRDKVAREARRQLRRARMMPSAASALPEQIAETLVAESESVAAEVGAAEKSA